MRYGGDMSIGLDHRPIHLTVGQIKSVQS
jgi:hypothetical protein